MGPSDRIVLSRLPVLIVPSIADAPNLVPKPSIKSQLPPISDPAAI